MQTMPVNAPNNVNGAWCVNSVRMAASLLGIHTQCSNIEPYTLYQGQVKYMLSTLNLQLSCKFFGEFLQRLAQSCSSEVLTRLRKALEAVMLC